VTEIDPATFEECLKLEMTIIPQSAAVRLDIRSLDGRWHTHSVKSERLAQLKKALESVSIDEGRQID
jgi:hypothetical protein